MNSDEPDFDLSVLNREDDYILDNIDSILPIVQKCVTSSEDDMAVLRAIEIAFGMCLHSITIEEYESKIFKYACPAAKSLFIKTLQMIENFKPNSISTQSDIGDIYSHVLHICGEIIGHLHRAYQYLSDIEIIAVNNIQSLPESTVKILYQAYLHCKNSEQLYGAYYTKLTEALTNLSVKTFDLQCQLLNLLTKQVEFHCEIEDELALLDKVMVYLYKSSSCLMNDFKSVKAMADLWKAYAALITKYSEQLKNHHSIAEPINCLCDHLVENLNQLIVNESIDKISVVKIVKIRSFILKLIIKFCGQFCGYLGDCQESLLRLLIILSKYSQPYLEFFKKPEYVISEVTSQLTIGLEPLLSQVITDRGIVREFNRFFDQLGNNSDSAYGFLLLCCSVLKKLQNSNLETRKLWLNSSYDVVGWIFSSLNFCQYELISNFKFQSILVPGKQKRFIDLYEHVLVNTSAFVLSSNSKEFANVEKVLLKNILQTNPWPALLAMDVWCVLARFAEADLCHSQLQILSKILTLFPVESLRPEKEYLACLIQRLFPLMVQKDQDNFIKSFPIENNPQMWGSFGVHNLSLNVQSQAIMQLRSLATDSIYNFSDSPSVSKFLELEKCLLGLNQAFLGGPKELSDRISNLWGFENIENLPKSISERYFKILSCSTASVLSSFTSTNLLAVLTQIKKSVLTSQSASTKLYILQILKKLATVQIPTGNSQKSTIQIIASTFHVLLNSENTFIKQKALEIFTYFAHVTSHPEIVQLAVKSNVSLQSDISSFLQKKLKQQWDPNVFFKKENVEYLHICYPQEVYEPSSKKPRLNGNNKSDEDFRMLINRIKADAITIRDEFNNLSESQVRQIREVHDIFSAIIKSS